jgi:hypothetical protein
MFQVGATGIEEEEKRRRYIKKEIANKFPKYRDKRKTCITNLFLMYNSVMSPTGSYILKDRSETVK